MFKNIEDLQQMNKEQMEAVTASATAWSKGIQQIATEASDYTKKSFEASSGVIEKLLGAKTLDKAIEINTEFAKQAYEGMVAQATKIGELYSSMAKEAFKPVEEAIAKVQVAAK